VVVRPGVGQSKVRSTRSGHIPLSHTDAEQVGYNVEVRRLLELDMRLVNFAGTAKAFLEGHMYWEVRGCSSSHY
jgi:hypothetical protein